MSEPAQRRLAAIVSADVVGYSRLMQADEAGTHARLKARFQDLFVPSIARYGGRVFKLMGDGLLAEFPSVIAATEWAVEVQSVVAKANTGDPSGHRIEYRVGINLGDVIVDGDDLYGDGVNVAARLQEVSEPGGVCLSDSSFQQVRGKIKAAFADGGEVPLKNIEAPVRVWRWTPGGGELASKAAATATATLTLPDRPSIAVLPFNNMSADPEQGFFADGIAEDIITALSKVSAMRVIARNSTFAYKGQATDLRKVAAELGVRYVLEGSVRRGGNRLRITAQLIDAADGSHLWAERFDRVADDLFDIQDEITKEIVTALRVKLTDGELALVWARGTENLEAWQYGVRAGELFLRFNSTDYLEARELARRATELDPNYATAWAFLGFTWWWDGRLGYTGDSDAKFAKAAEHAERAMALDDANPMAIGLSAMAASARGRYDEGIAIAERGFASNPGNADVRAFLAYAQMLAGRFGVAVEHLQAAMALNPFAPIWYYSGLCRCLMLGDRLESALAIADRLIAAHQDAFNPRLHRAYILQRLGRLDEAREMIDEVRRLAPRLTVQHLTRLMMQKPDAATRRFAEVLRELGLPD